MRRQHNPVQPLAGRGPDAELLVDLALLDERRGRDIRQRRVRAVIDAGLGDDVPGLAGSVIRPHQAQGRRVAVGVRREHVGQPQIREVAHHIFQERSGYLERGDLAGERPRLNGGHPITAASRPLSRAASRIW